MDKCWEKASLINLYTTIPYTEQPVSVWLHHHTSYGETLKNAGTTHHWVKADSERPKKQQKCNTENHNRVDLRVVAVSPLLSASACCTTWKTRRTLSVLQESPLASDTITWWFHPCLQMPNNAHHWPHTGHTQHDPSQDTSFWVPAQSVNSQHG